MPRRQRSGWAWDRRVGLDERRLGLRQGDTNHYRRGLIQRRFTRNASHPVYQAMLALHILPAALVYVSTLMIQEVLAEPESADLADAGELAARHPEGPVHEPGC